MTREQFDQILDAIEEDIKRCFLGCPEDAFRVAQSAYAAGVAAEREACAQVCADYTAWAREWVLRRNHIAAETAANECAVAILARGEK